MADYARHCGHCNKDYAAQHCSFCPHVPSSECKRERCECRGLSFDELYPRRDADSIDESRQSFREWEAKRPAGALGPNRDLGLEAFAAGFLTNACQLKEAEEALLEAQNERDTLREKLDKYEPPYRPEKHA